MIPAGHAPSYYLTDEAASARMAKLIQRIAKEGLKAGESVPAHIMAAARAASSETMDRRAA